MAEHLRDVPAVLGMEGLADLVVLECRDGLLELRRKGARSAPAEIAPISRRSGILRGHLGNRAEVLALQDSLAQPCQLAAHGGIVRQLIGLHEDVPHVYLVLDCTLGTAADLVQANDVITGRGAQRLADFAGLEPGNDVREEGRQLASLAPTERTALERGLAV